MIDITKEIPDPNFLISLPTEELGIKILFILKKNRQSGPLTVNHLLHDRLICENNDYRDKRTEVEQVILEAWNWLEVQGFLVWSDTLNGGNGFRRISRIAERFINEAKARNYVFSSKFSKELLHPRIAEKVWNAFVREEYDNAVLQAFKEVEVYVREASKLNPEDIGTALMRKAFHQASGALTDKNLPSDSERESMAHLFAGAIGIFKNPQSHRHVAIISPEEAMEMIMIANYLLRIVDYNSGNKTKIL